MRESSTIVEFLRHAWQSLMHWLSYVWTFASSHTATMMDAWRWPVGEQLVWWAGLLMVFTGCWSYLFRSDDLSRKMRGTLLGLRFIAAAALVWMLMGPAEWAPVASEPVKPKVIVLGDISASMNQKDVTDFPEMSRWESLGKTWLDPEYLARVRQWAQVYPYHFDKQLHAVGKHVSQIEHNEDGDDTIATSDRLGTDLFGALDRAVGGVEADTQASAVSTHTAYDDTVANDKPLNRGGIVLLLSDGHDTRRSSDPALLSRLGRKGWPVFSVAVGSDQRTSDVALLAWADSDFVLQGQKTTLHAAITQHGFDGQLAKVDLLHEGRLVASRSVRFGHQAQGDPLEVSFEIEPQSTGRRPLSVQGYQLVVQPMQGEQYVDNNRRWVFLQVSREQIRIALFEGEPYWDTRFLAQTLSQDPGVELTAMYGLGAGRELMTHHAVAQSLPTLTLPLTDEQLARYDIIILGRGCEQFFPGQRASLLVNYVRKRGGALVLARGRAFDVSTAAGAAAQRVVEPIEPVQWGQGVVDSLTLEMAPAGRRSPLLEFNLPEGTDTILTRLPDMLAATRIVQEKAASVVLLTQNARRPDGANAAGASRADATAGMAALVHQNVGAGQVLAMLSDGMWQWAFLPGSLKRYDSVYQQFWSRTIRWLATGGQFLPGQSVSLSLSRLRVEPGEEVTVTVAARDLQNQQFSPVVNVIAPDGSRQAVAMGLTAEQSNRWSGQFKPTLAGVHVVELLTPGMEPDRSTARLAVYDQSAEVLDPSARPMTLKTLSAATHGSVYTLADREKFLEDLQRINLARKSDRHLVDVFDRPWVLVVLAGALGCEWFLRRRRGLL